MVDRYAVLGNPVKHSKSPAIHRFFALQTDQDIAYTAIQVPLDGFNAAVTKFCEEGGRGFNVTVPFKQQAFERMDECSERAALAGAVNTVVVRKDGTLYGDNTDGVGLVRDILNNHEGRLIDKRILLLGAGGAVRGVLGFLLQQKPLEIVIANRTVEKAEELATHFSPYGRVSGCAYSQLGTKPFDWIINGTSASLQGDLPPLHDGLVSRDTWCYDMMYGKETTVFNQWAEQRGAARAIDGLGMLVEQAAEAFRIWRDVLPLTAPVTMELRSSM
ncbi:shikimate 5-dehydrogenase [gamma proteobacterium HdN1]|nr:shikimate 5-dehydrogenase [gamma proteobacterium HdN1]